MPKVNKLKEPEDILLKQVFDSLPDGIIILDKSFSVINLNEAAQNIFRISRKKAVNKQPSSFLPEEIEETAKKALSEERIIMEEEISPILRGGERISVQTIASPLFSDTDDLKGVIIQIKDLAASKFVNERTLQQLSSSSFEGFFIGLAHELKNPLSGIRGAAQILSNDAEDREAKKCAEIIIKEADRLRDLIDKFKRLEPFAKDSFELVDIHEILTEITFLESKSSNQNELNIIQNFDVSLPPISGDENSLKQVFLNIIKNAKEAGSSKVTIEISTRWITDYKFKNENAISIDIKDNGAGISKEAIEKIFTPFYTTKKEGTGLGLFLAYQIIAKHGGAILVESEIGKGTTFRVYLPIKK